MNAGVCVCINEVFVYVCGGNTTREEAAEESTSFSRCFLCCVDAQVTRWEKQPLENCFLQHFVQVTKIKMQKKLCFTSQRLLSARTLLPHHFTEAEIVPRLEN